MIQRFFLSIISLLFTLSFSQSKANSTHVDSPLVSDITIVESISPLQNIPEASVSEIDKFFGPSQLPLGPIPEMAYLSPVDLPEQMLPARIQYKNLYETGTILIDQRNRFLYLVDSGSTAIRYAIGVGREGAGFSGGHAVVGAKKVWPSWMPTKKMIEQDPYAKNFEDGMPGGPDNPLGARALYLFQKDADTYYRIHGTNKPTSVGLANSNGCFRMLNSHIMDLYDRVIVGAKVFVFN